MTAASRERFAAVVRADPVDLATACLLIATEAAAGVDPAAGLAALDVLAAGVRALLPAGGPGDRDHAAQADALRTALGDTAGFHGRPEDYRDLRSSLLPEVLARRRGLPILLSVVWVEVARRAGIPAYPVALPGHVVVGVGTPDRAVLVDPYDGGRLLTAHDAAEKVRAAGLPFTRDLLAPTGGAELLLRVLTNIRLLAAQQDRPRVRLWAVELSLLLPSRPAALRRERGEVLARLGDYRGGARELSAYADAVEPVEPAAAEAARAAARSAHAKLN